MVVVNQKEKRKTETYILEPSGGLVKTGKLYTDFYSDLKTMIEEYEPLYPGIDLWFRKKVAPELAKGKRRHGIIIYHDDKPVGSAIIRKGEHVKICSMRVTPDYQHKHLGRALMAAITFGVYPQAKTFHFTIPEELWESHKGFFEQYGFRVQEPSKKQYRAFSQELACSASYNQVQVEVIRTQIQTILKEGEKKWKMKNQF